MGPSCNQAGVAAWLIKGISAPHCIVRSGWTPGMPQDQSAYCSKLFGLWGNVYTVLKVAQKYKIHTGGVTIACDSLAALCQVQQITPPDPSNQHYNLISTIFYTKQQLLLDLKFEDVKGHQDTGVPAVLSQAMWMNIECDVAAKKWTETFKGGLSQYKLPYKGWCCYIKNQRIVKNSLGNSGNTLTANTYSTIGPQSVDSALELAKW